MAVRAFEKVPMTNSEATAGLTVEDARQIFDVNKPLIISDVDEVLLLFVAGLEVFIQSQGYWLDLTSYALHGNIKPIGSSDPAPNDTVTELISSFFREAVETLEPVDHASATLASLGEHADILLLSNVPGTAAAGRIRSLKRHGFDFPLIANSGPKGPAVAQIVEGRKAATFFIDDIPHHIKSVAEEAPDVHRIHFVADPRLAALIEPAKDSHDRLDDWPSVQGWVMNKLKQGHMG